MGYPSAPMANTAPNCDAPRLEPLALASCLTALVLGWCPLAGLAAIVTGAVALRRIRARPGTRTGTGLAATGIGIATAILVAEAWFLGSLQEEIQESMDAQSVAAVQATLTPFPEEAPGWDSRARIPDDAAQAEFARAASAKLGAVRAVAITNRAASGLTDPVVSITFNADCERGTAFGHATFATEPGTFPPRMLLRALEIEVAGERMLLPAAEATR